MSYVGIFGAGLTCIGALSAFLAGLTLWLVLDRWLLSKRYRQHLRVAEQEPLKEPEQKSRSGLGSFSLDEFLIGRMAFLSTRISLGHGLRFVPRRLVRGKWFDAHASVAGIEGTISAEGLCEMQLRMAMACAIVGMIAGALFSTTLMELLFVGGIILGWRMPARAIRRRITERAQGLEQHLPEMLDVVALGMRSGLSFDISLLLYARHFDTLLARALASAQQQWSCGLVTRDEALRHVARSYESPLFARVVESIVRSLRFGSSMVEGFEAAAAEARTTHRAQRQEQVAKAPVKMMIPTGVLILPAMLILVLGPVLLELMEGA